MTTDNISPPPEVAPPEPPPAAAPRRTAPWLLVLLVVALLALAGWQWRETHRQLDETRGEAARLAAAETAGKTERGQLLEQIEALRTRLDAVDSRLGGFESQGETLRGIYEGLAHGREDATLREVEQALMLAAQQLQLAGNVAAATRALQTADAQLARLDQPRHLPLRSALAKDLARLKALPAVDVVGISLGIEEIIGRVDKLPLAADVRPGAATSATPAATTSDGPVWRLLLADMWQELRGLVRIQRFDREEPALLAPEQRFFLRENLKLRLLTARLALFAHEQGSFRSELQVASDWLQRHFVAGDPALEEIQGRLRQWLTVDLDAAPPDLADSLAALDKLRDGKDPK
ncbi:MAG: uroporphyrinogen-III C-methyltransferase [Betaproteobacteria bacterium]|nr:uroporphyrinogen-III C-methyltransferase [Betaproteobacteria bacterium]MCL2887255.1 uroporphyrinogen-III C-methyltransferase [Betaproteobacteria bacterium]